MNSSCAVVLACVIYSGAFSATVPKEIWEDPCAGPNPVKRLSGALPRAMGFSDFKTLHPISSLWELISKSNEYKDLMSEKITDIKYIETRLDTVASICNFPSERINGSGSIKENTTMLTEDYERLSKLFIFVENSKLRRKEKNESIEAALLNGLENKIRQILCKMSASGISLPSPITRNILKCTKTLCSRSTCSRIRTPSKGSERNELDYVVIRNMVRVLESIQAEYERLF